MATIKDSKESRTIFLMLTNQCNLRCSYCYERNKHKAEINTEPAVIDFKTAESLIDLINKNKNL